VAKHRVLIEFASNPAILATAGSDAGWTESFYDPTDLTDDDAEAKARALINGRSPCLTVGWRAVAIRISQLDTANNLTRKGRLVKLVAPAGIGSYNRAMEGQDEQPWDSINLAIATVGGARRAFLMRGIGSDVLNAAGVYVAPPAFVLGSAQLATALSGGGNPNAFIPLPTTPYAVRNRSATAVTQISNVLTTAPAGINAVVDATKPLIRVPHATVTAGTNLSIIGVTGMTSINGQWRANTVQNDPTTGAFDFVGLLPRRRVTVKGTYESGGSVTYWTWTLTNITGFTIGNGASRRTGRPPQQRRGRRSARRS